jgi:tetraacyldisaccharide 4'-kinase
MKSVTPSSPAPLPAQDGLHWLAKPWLRKLLYWPAKFYQLLVSLRAQLYVHQYLTAKQLPIPVISIGNLTLGGTGKTPLVEYLADYLISENFTVAVLSRGYRRQQPQKTPLLVDTQSPTVLAQAGDEPLMLARKLPQLKVIVGANRYAGGQLAVAMGCEVVLLDDGFQHLALARDLNIVVLDGTAPFDNGEMPPWGRLREPLYGLKRAQALVVTRADQAIEQDQIFQVLNGLNLEIPIIYAYHEVVGLRDLLHNRPLALRQLAGLKVAALCALGNPQVFLDDLASYQAQIVSQHCFRDHHPYTALDLTNVAAQAQTALAQALVTTDKDAVKLLPLLSQWPAELPIYVLEIKMRFDNEVKLRSLLLRAITQRQRSRLR